MMAPGHALSGATFGLALAPLIPHPVVAGTPLTFTPVTTVFVAITTLCALVPDLDQPGAKLSRMLGPITWGLAWLIKKLSQAVHDATATPLDRSNESGHRSLTHTLAWCLLCGLAVHQGFYWTSERPWALWAGTAVLVGNLAHLWGDSLTLYGVPFWWPLRIQGQRWHCVHLAPRFLRFGAGAHTKRHRLEGFSRWAWVNMGEGVVTSLLTVTVGAEAVLTLLAGNAPWWHAITVIEHYGKSRG